MSFLLSYPLIVTVVYLVGTLMYYFLIETAYQPIVEKRDDEGISFLVPCYNEEDTIADTIQSISNLKFPKKEIIVINDGSTDGTLEKLRNLQQIFQFKVINFEENKGKANGLNAAIKQATFNYVMGVDADTTIDQDAPYYMLEQFRKYHRVGAVTGNPKIRNKRSLLSRIQILEYASIIGSIKRQQSLNGYVNTVSGVFTLFNKDAILSVGGFDIDMITEDIAISWKFHLHNWRIVYEPRALCRMIVPETMGGLWKQRKRWAQGGQEVLFRDWWKVIKTRKLPFIILMAEQFVSLFWAFSVISVGMFNIVDSLVHYQNFYDFNLIVLSSFIMVTFNIIFFSISLLIDSRYENINLLYVFYLPWYPFFYWFLNAIASTAALPKSITRKKGEFATWTSPDRG